MAPTQEWLVMIELKASRGYTLCRDVETSREDLTSLQAPVEVVGSISITTVRSISHTYRIIQAVLVVAGKPSINIHSSQGMKIKNSARARCQGRQSKNSIKKCFTIVVATS